MREIEHVRARMQKKQQQMHGRGEEVEDEGKKLSYQRQKII